MDGIVVQELSKRFGSLWALSKVSFTAPPGRVTAILGPNGSGKTTLLRSALGLVAPTEGRVTVGGRAYRELEHPWCVVGAVLEASGFHPGRSARDHLRVLGRIAGLSDHRVDEVIAMVGLGEAGGRRVGGYSLGMRQRLGVAAALLGDPRILILDEPTNGLDPHGIHWLRSLARGAASEGRTVLLASHLLSEIAQCADDVVVLNRGRLVAQGTVAEFGGQAGLEEQFLALTAGPKTAEVI